MLAFDPMAEELQSLLDKIQREGVGKAETKAAEIVAAAETKAAGIVGDAEKKAKQSVERAEREAAAFAENSEKSLKQAARDVILSVGEAVARTMDGMVAAGVGKALTPDVLKDAVVKVVDLYARDGQAGSLEVRLNPRDREQIQGYFTARFAAAMESGLKIESDAGISGGFVVRIKGGSVSHDFSSEAIAEALCGLVRPRLAGIVNDAVKGGKASR